jgi:hypothetical protein
LLLALPSSNFSHFLIPLRFAFISSFMRVRLVHKTTNSCVLPVRLSVHMKNCVCLSLSPSPPPLSLSRQTDFLEISCGVKVY